MALCTPGPREYSFQTVWSAVLSIRLTRSRVSMSKSRTELLYSGGLPAAAMIQPSGIFWLPKVLHCRNCSMVGARVSLTQLISSMKRMPSLRPVSSIRW